MVWCNSLFCFLVLRALACFVAVSYGSIRDGSTFRLTNEETDPTEFETNFRRDFIRDANEPRSPTGVVTGNGSLAFDSDGRESNHTTGMACEYRQHPSS